jgi:hypothetical protein
MEMVERNHYCQCSAKYNCVLASSFFFQANGIVGFGGFKLIFLVILSELTLQDKRFLHKTSTF